MGAVYGVLRARRGLAQDYEQEQERRLNKAYVRGRKKRRGGITGGIRRRSNSTFIAHK